MSWDRSGERNPNWKGGRRRAGQDMKYWAVYVPEHPAAWRGCVLEHRLVMERTLGRYLRDDEIVHHLNGDTGDNRPENLAVMTQGEHAREHFTKPPEERICPGCGATFVVVGATERRKRYCTTPCARRNRPRPDIRAVWFDRLRPAMERPGEWVPVYTHRCSRQVVSYLRLRRVRVPAGNWEFRSRGEVVEARHSTAMTQGQGAA